MCCHLIAQVHCQTKRIKRAWFVLLKSPLELFRASVIYYSAIFTASLKSLAL